MGIAKQAIRLAIQILLLTMVCEGGFPVQVAAHAPVSSDSNQDAVSFVFAGMRRERSRLRGGVGRITGKLLLRNGREKEAQENLFAFDGESKLRFDRSGPGMVIDEATRKPDPMDPSMVIASGKLGRVFQFWYTNGDKSCFWQGGQPIINLGKVGAWEGKQVHYFDVRALGLYSWVAYSRGYDFNKMAETFRSMQGLKKIDKTDPDFWVIVWESSDLQLTTQWRIQVDVEHGFTPRRLDLFERPVKDPASPWIPLEAAETKWEQRSQVWVPVSHATTVFRDKQPIINLSLQVQWEQVNGPIPARYFHYEDFHAPDAVGVIDDSLGTAIFVKPFQPQGGAGALPASPGLSWLRVFLLGFSVFVLLLIVYYQVKRMIRKGKPV